SPAGTVDGVQHYATGITVQGSLHATVTAGLSGTGTIRATVDMHLNSTDPIVRLDQSFMDTLVNDPGCVFQVTGNVLAEASLSITLDLGFTTIDFADFTLAQETLVSFATCTPDVQSPPPSTYPHQIALQMVQGDQTLVVRSYYATIGDYSDEFGFGHPLYGYGIEVQYHDEAEDQD